MSSQELTRACGLVRRMTGMRDKYAIQQVTKWRARAGIGKIYYAHVEPTGSRVICSLSQIVMGINALGFYSIKTGFDVPRPPVGTYEQAAWTAHLLSAWIEVEL